MEHCFVVCAYKDSPYLAECLESILSQSLPAQICIATSTPSDFIRDTAAAYGIPLYINPDRGGGIGRDWNFAYGCTSAELVTIAHQDDIYHREYSKTVRNAKKRYPDMVLFFSDALRKKGDRVDGGSVIHLVKRFLRFPLALFSLSHLPVLKNLVLRLGNPVICPSCTYVKKGCPFVPFSERYRFVLDWEFLLRLSRLPGRWISFEKPLLTYRVHAGAATMASIADDSRCKEEAEIFARLLPGPLARAVRYLYRSSYENYKA